MKPVLAAAFVSMVLLPSTSALAQSDSWTFTALGGYAPGYVHQYVPRSNALFGSSPARSANLPATGIASLAVHRRLSGNWTLFAEGSAMQFEGSFETLNHDVPLRAGSLEASFVTLGAGARYTRETPGWRTRVFVEAAPMAVWSSHESNTYAVNGSTGNERHTADQLLSGWTLGAGFGGPLSERMGYELRLGYLHSSDPDTDAAHDTYFATDLEGLSTFVFSLGLSWAP